MVEYKIEKGKNWKKIIQDFDTFKSDVIIFAESKIKTVKVKGKEYDKRMLPEIPVNGLSYIILPKTTWEKIIEKFDRYIALESAIKKLIAELEAEFTLRKRILAQQIAMQQKIIQETTDETLKDLRTAILRDLEYEYSICAKILEKLRSFYFK